MSQIDDRQAVINEVNYDKTKTAAEKLALIASFEKLWAEMDSPTPTTSATSAKTTKKVVTYPLQQTTSEAIEKVSQFLQSMITRMDFELASKTNPKNENGEIQEGKWQVLQIYLTSGKYAKNKLTDLILHKIEGTIKVIPSKDETPIEQALRDYVAGKNPTQGPPIPEIPIITPAPAGAPAPAAAPAVPPQNSWNGQVITEDLLTQLFNSDKNAWAQAFQIYWGHPYEYFFPSSGVVTPPVVITPPAPAQPRYVRYIGSPDIFDRQSGSWISPTEALGLGIFNTGAVQDFTYPRPEVKTGTDFAVWNNRNLTIFPV